MAPEEGAGRAMWLEEQKSHVYTDQQEEVSCTPETEIRKLQIALKKVEEK